MACDQGSFQDCSVIPTMPPQLRNVGFLYFKRTCRKFLSEPEQGFIPFWHISGFEITRDLTSTAAGNGSVVVILEPQMPVRPVAERLVLGPATSTQREPIA